MKNRYDDMLKYKKGDKYEDAFHPRYIILVPKQVDKNELKKAFEYLHDQDIDTSFVAVNDVVHEYLDNGSDGVSQIMVNEELYDEAREEWLKLHPELRKYWSR